MLDREKQTKDGNKAHDAKINWGLRQVSQVSQKEERSPVRMNTGSVVGDYNARQSQNDASRRESINGRINVGMHIESHRMSPVPLVSQSPQHDNMRSNVILAPKDHATGSRFAQHRNDGSRMSMSMQSESGKKWPRQSFSLTKPTSPAQVPLSNFGITSMKQRNNSLYGTFPTSAVMAAGGNKNNGGGASNQNFETRSVNTR